MWARELALKSGLNVPNTAAEHYYLITDTIDGLGPDTPVFEDPAAHGYYREEGGGMMVGLFEPRAAAWHPEGVPAGSSFTKIQPDWDRMGPFLETAMARVPVTLEAGVRTFFCGPESFTPDLSPIVGEAPGHPRLLRRRRHELRRRPVRRRPRPGRRAVDRRRQARRRRDRLRRRPVPRVPGRGVLPGHPHHRDPRHRVRRAHARQAAVLRPRGQALPRPRPAGRQRRATSARSPAGRAPTGSPVRARRPRRRRRGATPTGSPRWEAEHRVDPRGRRPDGHVVHDRSSASPAPTPVGCSTTSRPARSTARPSGSPTPSGSTTTASCRPT